MFAKLTISFMRLFWRRKGTENARLIQAAGAISRTLECTEDAQIAALRQEGFDEGEAHRLAALLPIAFSRPVLEDLGVRNFVRQITAYDADGSLVTADLLRQPEYVGGVRLAREHRKRGLIDPEVYERICHSSADLDAASNALNSGADIKGATIASALVGTSVARHLVR